MIVKQAMYICTGTETRPDQQSSMPSQERVNSNPNSLPHRPDSDVAMQSIEEGLRQSYGMHSARPSNAGGPTALSTAAAADDFKFEALPKQLATILSGVSGSATPSAAEMNDLDSQLQRLA